MSLPLPQGYVAVHVAQPSATYVHSVRCSERHRSERLLVRLFVLACACVCVCVLQRACASVCTCVCTIARCCAQVASARGAASCSMHLHAQLCQRAMHKSVVCEQCVKQRIVGLRFRKFFFSMCAHNGKQTTARKRALRIASAFCCTALRQESQSEWGSEFSTRCCSLQSC